MARILRKSGENQKAHFRKIRIAKNRYYVIQVYKTSKENVNHISHFISRKVFKKISGSNVGKG